MRLFCLAGVLLLAGCASDTGLGPVSGMDSSVGPEGMSPTYVDAPNFRGLDDTAPGSVQPAAGRLDPMR